MRLSDALIVASALRSGADSFETDPAMTTKRIESRCAGNMIHKPTD
jgi:hypothetical protein